MKNIEKESINWWNKKNIPTDPLCPNLNIFRLLKINNFKFNSKKKVFDIGFGNGENLLELKINPEYIRYTKSVRGDIKNAEFGCSDKNIVSLFLLNFIPKTYYKRWIHINLSDITVKNDLAILEGSYSIMDFIKKI